MELNAKSKMITALFSLLLTLILFTNANTPEQKKQQKPTYNYEETVKQVPIVFEYNEKKYYIQGYEPNVDVKLSSANRVQLLAESNADTRTFKVVADLNKLSTGTHEVKLKVENLKSGVKAKLSTSKSTVTIEKKISKKFAVKPILADERQLDGVTLSSITSTPKSVLVTTGAQTMKEIAIVQALFTSNNPITQNITKSVKLEALNAKGGKLDVTFDKEEVEVHLAVKRVNKEVKLTPKQYGNLPSGVSGYQFHLNPETIMLSSNGGDLDKIEEITIPVDISGIAQTTTKVYNIPVDSAFYSPQSNVTIRIEPIYTQVNRNQNLTEQNTQTNGAEDVTQDLPEKSESSTQKDSDKQETTQTTNDAKNENEKKNND
ncbi:CdaR family protein [Enterococcus cecorum]|uniref:CdaR family protein n=1 Tax=Enterococcus cecorum TaxID=44008 RepID=UPI001FADF64C|nr:CdaR family protein [Enterococcus cecorum]MCJ0522658.1 CdaR family protein [Enterococcus cecorum]MCJ0559316.1 CdaR family protein [Enterococcus cecorum]MCJ0598641.1 CdaR family protein [Enterococcus cecorum]MCJ0603372.1 CdaR family protein [Enterococcus cecorum]